jgi:hypothetical protein
MLQIARILRANWHELNANRSKNSAFCANRTETSAYEPADFRKHKKGYMKRDLAEGVATPAPASRHLTPGARRLYNAWSG